MTYTRIMKAPENSFFLLGMRGVGKSTWVKKTLPSARRFDFLDEQLYQDLLVEPGLFAKQLQTLELGSWVILDEIQRLPQLLNEVHRAIEEQGLLFALVGSSARKLRRSGTNLLGGRALQRFMYPLTPFELGSDFSLDHVLTFGTIPLIVTAPSPHEQLAAYTQIYLRQEIQAEALVRNLPGFARFLPVAALFHGQVLNVQGLGRDAGLSRPTTESYISILEDTLLAFRLPAFEGKLRVKERKSPKFYFCDPGIVRAAKKQLGPIAIEERGPLLEGFIIQLLITSREYGILDFDDIYYWTVGKTGPEVDIILRRGRSYTAIEIKSCRRLRKEYFSGLHAVSDLKGLDRRLLIYEGERKFVEDRTIEVLPLPDFLSEMEDGKV